ncbi:hypothetical protein [Microbulbifer pacificus]|uniref:hypothetical protein n=1 Tax=Microbulbifer pacificus TaxID=407164 RepID=UPI00131A3D9C|nr:hypothetical protein [Microbulbifer pacificus]
MNKLIVTLILMLVVSVGGAVYGYVQFSYKLDRAEELVKQERDLRKINVKNSMLTNVTEFVFTKITNQYTYYYDTSFVTGLTQLWGGDKVRIVYEWPYTFSFGVKIPDGWNWCPKEVDGKPGFVSVQAPKPSLISKNDPSPKYLKVIKAPSHRVNDETVSEQINEIAKKRIEEDAESYLQAESVSKNISLAFSKHLQDILNMAHANSNPVAGVEIEFVDDNSCG